MTILALMLAAATVECPTTAVETTAAQIETAIVARDFSALDRLIHPDFVMIHAGGMKEGRTAWMKVVGEGRLSRQTAERSEYQVEVTRSGETAVRAAVVRFRDARRGQDMWLRGTMFLRCDGGTWRQYYHQSSMLSEGPLANAANLNDYVGDWRLPDGRTFALGVEDRLLTLTWENGAKTLLLPHAADRFGNGVGIQIRFSRGPNGRVISAARGDSAETWWTAYRR